jgi:hypothetical protein
LGRKKTLRSAGLGQLRMVSRRRGAVPPSSLPCLAHRATGSISRFERHVMIGVCVAMMMGVHH